VTEIAVEKKVNVKSVIRTAIPWWVKIAAKIFLSRLPVHYKTWKKIRLFQHGYMDSPQYAYSVFMEHFKLAVNKSDFVCMEIGPGDSLFSALIAKALGAQEIFLVDIGDYCSRDMGLYKAMYEFLVRQGYHIEVDLSTFDCLMRSCRATYMTSGLASLKEIASGSVDFIFSQAVFEHIRKNDFLPILKEVRRILKPTGISSHVADLRDHIGGALNNLRFSELVWESDFFARSGFYTNRIRFLGMLDLLNEAGFNVKVLNKEMWAKLPTARNKLHGKFRLLSEQDLRVAGFMVLLTC
jgi:SAM-dependent methyltransferase